LQSLFCIHYALYLTQLNIKCCICTCKWNEV